VRKSILASIVCSVSLATAPAQFRLRTDTSAMAQIFQLMERLERDEEPSQADWDALFGTAGYRTMLARERSRGPLFYSDNLRISCKPSLAKEYDRILRTPEAGWEKEVMAKSLPHFRKAQLRRSELKAMLLELEQNDIGPKVLDMATPYAPHGVQAGDASVAFLLFGPDARGYDPIIVDALFYLDQGKQRELTLAHELHHLMRGRQEARQVNGSEEAVWCLRQIMLEGIADRINKAPVLEAVGDGYGFRSSEEGKDYLEQLERCPDIIRSMDALLVRMAKAAEQAEALGRQLVKLVPRSGHLPGYYMASLIETRLGRSRLIEEQVNPASFFSLYDEAAAKDGKAPRFSKVTLAYIRHLCRPFEPFSD